MPVSSDKFVFGDWLESQGGSASSEAPGKDVACLVMHRRHSGRKSVSLDDRSVARSRGRTVQEGKADEKVYTPVCVDETTHDEAHPHAVRLLPSRYS